MDSNLFHRGDEWGFESDLEIMVNSIPFRFLSREELHHWVKRGSDQQSTVPLERK